ncbi:MAG: outer membrane beta-barrel protein, partial [Desulfuromonadales bacterium]|nr:outer membrane beta-barrel protein [Desulfuromonadales bacterium]
GFGLRYDLNRNLFLGADYTFSHRNSDISNSSNLDAADYYRHQFMISLGANLYPVKEDPLKGFSKALEEMYVVNEPPQGFYLGGLVSYGATATNASEERSHGGSSQADFGGDAFSAGLFGGYSINHGRWVYGLEIEVEDSDLEWKHVKNKNESRTFSVKQNEGLGASARLGYTMLDGSVLYGRIGFIKTRFDTSYTINATALDSYSETETLTGLRLAMGLDVPLTEQWFWRMETTYTDYETYKVDSVAFSEKFDPEESFFSFGLGWHFDASEQHAEPIAIEDLSGPYAGVKLGFGTLTSEVNGLHSEGGGAESGPFSYQSDFAGQKFTSGLFLGYGKSFDRVYVGAEFEAEVNATEWFRKRKTSGGGRNFSAEAKEAYAASARLGYQCRNGSLAYLKAGVVTAKVITRYAKGSNRDNDIYSDRDVDGIRFGGGIETSLTPATFVRLEYTHTEYEDYDLVTAHTNSDQLNFEHRQDMVSLGLGFRF